jgi:hypothetical protein
VEETSSSEATVSRPLLELPERGSIFVGKLAKRGHWLVAHLSTGIAWPIKLHQIAYRDQTFFIIPVTQDSGPAVALRTQGGSSTDGHTSILRFLSALAWSEGRGIQVTNFSGGSLPFLATSQQRGYTITEDFCVRDLPEPDATGQLALALMREARGLDHAAYSFLTFYRILEIAKPKGKERGAWIADALPRLTRQAAEAIARLQEDGIADVGEHLQKARRQAIAHASAQPIVDPDDFATTRALYQEEPIIAGLAQLAVEEVLGIKSSSTIYREHLYELAGFHPLIPAPLINALKSGLDEPFSFEIDLPPIHVELRRSEQFEALRDLQPVAIRLRNGDLELIYQSVDELVQFVLTLKFSEERLGYDFQSGFMVRDDGSAQGARHVLDALRFQRDYIGNGEIHIYNAETGSLLSRVDAFMPVNFWGNHTWFASEMRKWETLAAEREQTDARSLSP